MSRFSNLLKFIYYNLGQLFMFCLELHCLHLLLFTHAFADSDSNVLGCNFIETIRQKINLSVSIWTENWKPIKYVVQLNQDDETSLGGVGGWGGWERDCV